MLHKKFDMKSADISFFGLPGMFSLAALLFLSVSDLPGQIIESWDVFSALDRSLFVTVDSDENVWVGSTGGAYRLSPSDGSLITYRTSDGLLRLNVAAIGVDPVGGDVYFGSGDGSVSILQSEGGWTYVTDIARSTQSLRGVTGFFFADAKVYITTQFGVAVFDPSDSTIRDSWTRLGTIPPNSEVTDLAFFNDSVWVTTPFGLAAAPVSGRNLADPLNWRVFTGANLCGEEEAVSVEFFDGMLLVGTANGICEYADGTFTKRGEPGGRVLLAVNGSGMVAANDSRLFTYDPQSGFTEVGEAPRRIVSVAAFPDGTPVAAMERDGIVHLDGWFDNGIIPGEVETFAPNGPSANKFADLTFGADGDLWVATDIVGDGVARLSVAEGEWTNYTPRTRSELASDRFWRINADDFGRVWGGTFGDGFFVFEPEEGEEEDVAITHYNETNSPLKGISGDESFVIGSDVQPDETGITWILNWDNTPGIRGAALLAVLHDPETGADQFRLFPASNTFGASVLRSFARLAIDFNGNIWLGSDLRDGVLVFNPGPDLNDPGEWHRLLTSHGLVSNTVTALLVDPDGELWIGTPGGANVLVNPGTVATEGADAAIFRELRPLEDVVVRDIAVDALNRKWVATDKGVFLLSSDGTELLNAFSVTNSPLVSNDVLAILPDDQTGQIYVGTSAGLNRIQTEAIRPKEEPERIRVTPQPFNPEVDQSLRITGLPVNSTVKILKLDGSLVTEFRAPGGDIAFWTGLNAEGEPVASGVYLVAARSPLGETVIGKIAVVRQ